MANGITEIVEETSTQLEIVEIGSGQIEVTAPSNTSIEISFSGSLTTPNLEISPTIETLTVDSVTENTTVDVVESVPVNVEISSTSTIVEISSTTTSNVQFNNVLSNPFFVSGGNVGRGTLNPQYDLHVNGTTFANTISSSIVSSSQIKTNNLTLNDGKGGNILTVKSGSESPLVINSSGIMALQNHQYTPTAVEGGILLSGSSLYLGVSDS